MHKFLKEFSNLNEKRHPLYRFRIKSLYPILNSRASYNDLNVLIKDKKDLKLVISHTSNQVLISNYSLRSVLFRMSLLTSTKKYKFIYAKKSMASFNIQKNNLLGVKLRIEGRDLYDMINKFLILNKNLIQRKSNSGSIKDFIGFKDIEKEYDLIVGRFPNLNQFGGRITFKANDILEIKRFNI